MKPNIYSLFDKKSETYQPPFFSHNDMTAIRQVEMMHQNPETMLAQYPDDYILRQIGTFNDNTGEVYPCQGIDQETGNTWNDTPRDILDCKNLIKPEANS